MATFRNRQLVLVTRPHGIPQPENFAVREVIIDEPFSAPLVIRNQFLSVDPAQRGYVNEEASYMVPVPLGGVMRALALGRVIHSMDSQYAVGDHLYGWFGWQDYCLADTTSVLRKVRPEDGPLTMNLGVLGINGLTAFLAFYEIGAPRAGETIVISAAAGAVGSVAGQLARNAGCRTVGIVGDDKKGEMCTSRYGYHAVANYKSAMPLAKQLELVCPRGVDIYFDNTGGWILDEVIRLMNRHGRVIMCGTVATSSWRPQPQGPRQEREIVTRRLRAQGFVIFDYQHVFDETAARLVSLIAQGSLLYDEDIEDGLERAPAALTGLYQGSNRGKKIIRLATD